MNGKDFEMGLPGQPLEWRIKGNWVKFEIIGDMQKIPEGAKRLKHTVVDDHLEELWELRGRYYRYAGGGRGFYWIQDLTPLD